MSLSFEESLKNNNGEYPVSDEDIILENENIEPTSIMAYSMRSMPALLMDNDGWEKPDNYANYNYLNGQYADEDFSTVDSNKNIQLNSNQINITQEKNSQYIPFKIPRKYDGFDLANTALSIYYVNKNKQWGKDTPVDVYCNEDSIKFAWLVGERATAVSGILQFEIHAVGKNRLGNEYVWKTKSIATLNVIQSLEEIADGQIDFTKAEAQNLYNQIVAIELNIQGYLLETQSLLNEARDLVSELNDGIEDTVRDVLDDQLNDAVKDCVDDKLENYYTKDDTYDSDTIDQMIEGVKPEGYATEDYVDTKLGSIVDSDNQPLTVEQYVKQEVDAVDISDKLGELDGKTVKTYVDESVAAVDVSEQLKDYAKSDSVYTKTETYSKDEIDDALENISLDGYATETYVDDKISPVASTANTNKSDLSTLSQTVVGLQSEINSMDKSPRKTYEAEYGDITLESGETQESMFTLWETEGDGERTIKSRFKIAGGGGGASAGNNLAISYDKDEDDKNITQYVFTKKNAENNEAIIYYGFSGADSAGDSVSYANATWKTRKGTSGTWTKLLDTTIYPNEKIPFDISKYVVNVTGTCQIQLIATDESGGYASKTWTIQIVDIRLESSFNDTYTRPAGQQVTFDYTPYGAVSKNIHFKLYDKESKEVIYSKEISTQASSISNPVPFVIPEQEHGSYLLEAYITAEVNGQPIETEPIYKDIMFYDSDADVPVIGCSQQKITMRQYDTVNIIYHVFDPATNYPIVQKYVDNNLVDTETLTKSQNTWSFQTDEIGLHTLKIVVGDTEKIITVNVTELGIDVSPVTSGLEIDFNPTGITNSSADRVWSNNKYTMSVSDNFDWANGGYQQDDTGDTYFLIKAGTRVSFDYLMFSGGLESNPSVTGSEMKLIFMTENVQDKDAVWFSNVEKTTTEVEGVTQTTNVGIQLGVHEGWLKTNNASDADVEGDDSSGSIAATNTYLYMPYSEEDIIEMDINIDTLDRNDSESKAFAMAYEDGVPSKAYVYDSSDRFYQYTPQPITIGSDYCDVRIYRMKIYSNSLTTENIMKNFIADARNSTTMLDRYDRNSIYFNRETNTYTPYSGEGVIDPEKLAPIVPNVKILMLETDHFTTSKKTFVKSNFRCVHASGGDMFEGDPYYDNWLFENGWHSGQGTTSDNYGNSSRNVDFLFNCDGVHKPSDKVAAESDYISQVTLGYGTENETTEVVTDWKGDSGKVSLTRTSVPNNFFNLKVNVASSENVNNMLLQKRYNDFLPYISPAKKRNPNIKNSMEFVPAILFIRETNPDISTHTEFLDTEWHFYSLGNIGDSKKTDYTRAYDPEDMNEFTLEISDNTKNNAVFQSGVYLDDNGNRQIEKFTITESEDDGDIILTPVSIDKPQSFVYPITIEEWENEDNMRHWCIYNEGFDGDHSFEARYACCGDYRDGKLVNDTSGRGKAQMKLNEGVWRAFYRWVITSTNEEFVNELDEWCVRSAVEFFYAFTHYYTMMDSRAKNTFWHFAKTGVYRKVSKPVPELLHIYCELIGDEYITTTDTTIDSSKTYYTQYAFDMHDYDNDTALGINNNGELVFPYGKEDTDYNVEGNPQSGYVFNGATSVFWCRLRDLLPSEITNTFQTVAAECFSATNLINQFDAYQECYPEEIWRLDIVRKYMRTFTGKSVDNSKPKHDVQYLRDMMQGRKKYQRRQWIRDQEIYFGTMNLMNTVVGDNNRITFRCFTPTGNDVKVAPDYTLRITPYSDMYISVAFGNSNPKPQRAKAGIEYTIECPLSTMDDTQVTIYGANRIQALNDLSACYIAANNFSMATKLRKLVIGSTVEGYNNAKLISLTLGNNKLLEELDIRNCNNLTGALNLVQCNNLLKLYAEGTKITGVTFATNGKIQVAHLPSTINTLIMRNLNDLVDFQAALNKVETLTLQGGNLDSLDIVTRCIDALQVLYLYDINWALSNAELLDKISLLFYSLLTGKVHVDAIKQKQLEDYREAWSDLDITYPEGGLIAQHAVTFVNADNTPLLNKDGTPMVQYVVVNEKAVDPSKYDGEGNPIFPVISSDVEYDYVFKEWQDANGNVFDFNTSIRTPITLKAVYTPTRRTYKIKYVTKTNAIEFSGTYGSNIPYNFNTHGIPSYTGQETANTFHLFSHWDKSGFLLDDEYGTDLFNDGIKIVNAVYDIFEYDENISGLIEKNENVSINGSHTIGNFKGIELSELKPIHIYALTKLGANNIPLGKLVEGTYKGLQNGAPYTIHVGNDVDYKDVDSEVIVSEKTNFGNNNFKDTNIKLFDMDKDFVLAVDYEFLGQKSGTLMQCIDANGSGRGFKLWYDGSNVQFTYDEFSKNITIANNHEMIVVRNAKNEETGEYVLTVYNSNMSGDTVSVLPFTRNKVSNTQASLIFGASFAYGEYGNFADANVNWAKIWHKDLGEDVCKSLAIWPRESIEMNVCGFKRYILTDNTKCSFSLLASHLLERTKAWGSSSNDYGWAGSDGLGNSLNKFLNTRLYNAMPIQIRCLLKPTIVWGNDGLGQRIITENGSNKTVYYTDITKSNCYITIPSIVELHPSYQQTAPYNREIQNGDDDVTKKTISYMVNNESRIRRFSDGTAGKYWTRSPSVNYSNYICCIDEDGKEKLIGEYPYYSHGVLIEISF